MARRPLTVLTLSNHLRKVALAYPEATEDHPWGETAIKVKGKVFLFLHTEGDQIGFSVKLPESRELAMTFPFSEPTGYGLGRSGWVSVRLTTGDDFPVEHFEAWLDESYRAVAPKKLVKELDASR
jgi:predicted DNA-binding protein (MmcQ/YjbR family)